MDYDARGLRLRSRTVGYTRLCYRCGCVCRFTFVRSPRCLHPVPLLPLLRVTAVYYPLDFCGYTVPAAFYRLLPTCLHLRFAAVCLPRRCLFTFVAYTARLPRYVCYRLLWLRTFCTDFTCAPYRSIPLFLLPRFYRRCCCVICWFPFCSVYRTFAVATCFVGSATLLRLPRCTLRPAVTLFTTVRCRDYLPATARITVTVCWILRLLLYRRLPVTYLVTPHTTRSATPCIFPCRYLPFYHRVHRTFTVRCVAFAFTALPGFARYRFCWSRCLLRLHRLPPFQLPLRVAATHCARLPLRLLRWLPRLYRFSYAVACRYRYVRTCAFRLRSFTARFVTPLRFPALRLPVVTARYYRYAPFAVTLDFTPFFHRCLPLLRCAGGAVTDSCSLPLHLRSSVLRCLVPFVVTRYRLPYTFPCVHILRAFPDSAFRLLPLPALILRYVCYAFWF